MSENENGTVVAMQQDRQIARQMSATPAALLQIAMDQGADLDRLEKLMDMQTRWEEREAQKAFTEAMVAFKAENVVVTKDRTNKQHNSMYTSLGQLVSTVTPFLSRHGLSADWDIEQSSGITVTCIITHRLGGSKRVSFTAPPDTSGAKNVIQQIKSTITYAKAVTFESACGLASTDANDDDDGAGSGDQKTQKQQKPPEKARLAAPQFDRAKQALRDGKYTLQEVKDYYELTTAQEAEMSLIAKEMAK
jgi:hypothetical protein